MLAIDIDGNVEMTVSEDPPALDSALAITEAILDEVTSSVDAREPLVTMTAVAHEEEIVESNDFVDSEFEVELSESPPSTDFEELAEYQDVESPQIEVAPPAVQRPGSEGVFADEIAAFANAPTNFTEGPLHYDLTIEGIDTADIRGEIREALVDRKFVWDVDAILRTTENGRLHIRGLTAVKAVVLIQRLAYLPVHVSWEQHAIFEG